MKLRIAAALATLALRAGAAHAAEVFYLDHDPLTNEYVGPVGPLVLSGEIDPGDYERLLAKIAGERERFMASGKLILAAEDGDLGEAIKIAALVKSLSVEVVVGPMTGPCVGGCFLIYAAADQRVTDGPGLLGVHRPEVPESQLAALAPDDLAALQEGIVAWARAFLTLSDTPQNLIEAMSSHTAAHVYWLSPQDEQELGALSPSFRAWLGTRCGWNDTLERDVFKGDKPMQALQQVWACRARLTQPARREALDLALHVDAPCRKLPKSAASPKSTASPKSAALSKGAALPKSAATPTSAATATSVAPATAAPRSLPCAPPARSAAHGVPPAQSKTTRGK